MTYNASGTLNLSKGYSWKPIKKHAEHDPDINHSNKNIEFENTKYNIQGQLLDYDELMNSRYSDYVKEHDAKMVKSRHQKDVYGSVDNYLSAMKNQPYVTMVATFGDMELKKELLTRLDEYAFHKGSSMALDDYVRGFNERNSELKITDYVTNVDEKGAPHVHAQVVPMGRTKKGKPSTSLSTALNNQYHTTDSREALKMFRAQEDQELINSFNRVFGLENEPAFSLFRTNKKGGKPMPEYQEGQKILSKQKKEIEAKAIQKYLLDKSIESKKKIKSSFDKEVEDGIYNSYSNLKSSGFFYSEKITPELVPQLANESKSYDPIDDSVHDGAGDRIKTFSGTNLINKFNSIYAESLERLRKAIEKMKLEYEIKFNLIKNKEKSLLKFEDSLNNRESDMNEAERRILEQVEAEREKAPKLSLSKEKHDMDVDLGLRKRIPKTDDTVSMPYFNFGRNNQNRGNNIYRNNQGPTR